MIIFTPPVWHIPLQFTNYLRKGSTMNSRFKIILWKEWQETKVNFIFILCIFLLAKLLQLFFRHQYPGWESMFNFNEGLAFFFLMLAGVYGLILGIGMFGMEYTIQTFPYLITRPVTLKNIMLSKWLMAIGQLIIMGLVGWIVSWIPISHEPGYAFNFLLCFLGIPFAFFVVSSFWSILLKNMTRALFSSLFFIALVLILNNSLVKMGMAVFWPKLSMSTIPIDSAPLVSLYCGIIGLFLLLLSILSIFLFLRQESK